MQLRVLVLQILLSLRLKKPAKEGLSMNETTMSSARRGWWHNTDASWINRRTVIALVAVTCTWIFSLTGLQQYAPAGLPKSVEAWSRVCPSCGTVESVAKLLTPKPSSELATYFYRLTIRMADGSIRRIEQPAPIPPGSQVLVHDGAVQRVVHPAPTTAQRQ
jgi:hypothetical protein